jgi:uncharacterized protein (TIGR03435 family)
MRVALAASFLVFSASGAFAQPAEPAPAFEVASVKVRSGNDGPGKRLAGGGPSEQPGGRPDQITPLPAGVTMLNVRLKAVVQWAYHLQPIQVSGPGWLDGDRFDIIAKAAGPATAEQLRVMTQTLLAERFKLSFHRETKEMEAYVVTVAKGGHKLKQSEGEGELDVKPDSGNRMKAAFTHVTLAQLSEMVSSPLQGVVVDQTGLKGSWDFSLDISNFADARPTSIDDAVGMIVQAVSQQLGIKIDQKKLPAEVLIVDHAERVPVEN